VGKEAPVADKPITSFHPDSSALLMLANRGGDFFIPRGDYVFKAGDRVIVTAKNENKKEIEKFFSVSL
jgi:trk system potassium uptake protein TrkA